MTTRSDSRVCLALVVLLALVMGACGAEAPGAASDPIVSPRPTPSATLRPSVLPATSPSVSTDWTLVALGDSIASEAASDGASYAHIYAKGIEELTGRRVKVVNLADASTTSTSLLASMKDLEGVVAKAVAGADIVTITAGGNDADPFATYPKGTCSAARSGADCLAAYNPGLESNYQQILAQVDMLRKGRPTVIRVTSPDYNPFIGWSQSPTATFGVDFYRQVAAAETEVVCRVAPAVAAACADFLTSFNGKDGTMDAAPYLAADHAHPGTAGRELIADVLIATGVAPLR